MDSSSIAKLLEKYWEGETSLQEETQLRTYFAEGEVAPELRQYQPLFQYFQQAQEVQPSASFDQKLLASLTEAPPKQAKVRSLGTYLRRIAAVAILVLAIGFALRNYLPANTEKDWQAQLTAEEMEAYTEVKAALALVSNKLNKGTAKAEQGIRKVNKATNIIK